MKCNQPCHNLKWYSMSAKGSRVWPWQCFCQQADQIFRIALEAYTVHVRFEVQTCLNTKSDCTQSRVQNCGDCTRFMIMILFKEGGASYIHIAFCLPDFCINSWKRPVHRSAPLELRGQQPVASLFQGDIGNNFHDTLTLPGNMLVSSGLQHWCFLSVHSAPWFWEICQNMDLLN